MMDMMATGGRRTTTASLSGRMMTRANRPAKCILEIHDVIVVSDDDQGMMMIAVNNHDGCDKGQWNAHDYHAVGLRTDDDENVYALLMQQKMMEYNAVKNNG